MQICDPEQAITHANACDDYLSTYGWKRDGSRVNYIIDRLKPGMVFENEGVCGSVCGQYDVHPRSCISGEDALCGLEKFCQKREVYFAN